ncbi:GD16761 [Drosophila simulans]|uniref:GD16761 n=1 Tax=Drosophila simulans TaxID=7240 RepID=B4R598_DROSI|nr:GD16761 [Drosophila simulans]
MSTEHLNDAEPVESASARSLVLDRALVNLLHQARRLHLNSVDSYRSLEASLEKAVPELPTTSSDTAHPAAPATSSARAFPKRKPGILARAAPKALKTRKTDTHVKTPRGVQCKTAHLPVPPPPPPPSPRCPKPRELSSAMEMADLLRIEIAETDALLDQMLFDAKALERQVVVQCQLHRDAELIRSLEQEYSALSMKCLVEAIQSDCESQDVQDLWSRCQRSLERHAERQAELESEEGLYLDLSEGEGTGKGTQTDVAESQDEILPMLVQRDLPMVAKDGGPRGSGSGDGHLAQGPALDSVEYIE